MPGVAPMEQATANSSKRIRLKIRLGKVRQSTSRPRSPKEMTGAEQYQLLFTELAGLTPRPESLLSARRLGEECLGHRRVVRELAERGARLENAERFARHHATIRLVGGQLTEGRAH